MVKMWFDWLTDISWDYPGLAIFLALLSGFAAAVAAFYLTVAALWLVQFAIWGGFNP